MQKPNMIEPTVMTRSGVLWFVEKCLREIESELRVPADEAKIELQTNTQTIERN